MTTTMLYKKQAVEVLQEGSNLTKILMAHGEECFVPTKDLSVPKPTREELYRAQVDVIRNTPVAYQVAGWLATRSANIHVSTPPKQLDATIEELISHGVDYDLGVTLTESTDATQGRSYSVVSDNHGLSNELFLTTGVVSTIYHDNPNKVSMQAKQFVLDFLLGELKFKLGKDQDVDEIGTRVPSQFMEAFLLGARE